jgi:hypothetical protein
LAQNSLRELAELSSLEIPRESLITAHSIVNGKLSILRTLLS